MQEKGWCGMRKTKHGIWCIEASDSIYDALKHVTMIVDSIDDAIGRLEDRIDKIERGDGGGRTRSDYDAGGDTGDAFVYGQPGSDE